MKLPESYESVTLHGGAYDVPYPPLGFCPFYEHELGNGDTFGLYWPIGLEDRDPIVAETYHDEWSIEPHFSSLDRFLAAAMAADAEDDSDDEGYDDDAYVGNPTIQDDPHSPAACLRTARENLKSQNVDSAIEYLEMAVSILPEYVGAQTLLSTQYRRVGKNDQAIQSAIQAIISPPCFGGSPVQLVSWLSQQKTCPVELESDPIWINRKALNLKFGGVKENDQYRILRDAIDQYLDASAFVRAMTLMQTYAELMYAETVSFQERYEFNPKEFVAWQRDVASMQYGTSRVPDVSKR